MTKKKVLGVSMFVLFAVTQFWCTQAGVGVAEVRSMERSEGVSSRVHIFSGVPGYQSWLFWSYSGRYPVIPRVYHLPRSILLVTGYQTCLFWSYSGMYPGTPRVYPILRYSRVYTMGYPGTKRACFGHTRAYTPGTPRGISPTMVYTLGNRVPNLVVLVILGYVPG